MSRDQVPGRSLQLHGGVQRECEGGGGPGEGALGEESQHRLPRQVGDVSLVTDC